MGLSERKRKWLDKQINALLKKDISKAEIARRLGILPQSLNNILNGTRGISDSFIESFENAYDISQLELERLADRISEICCDLFQLYESLENVAHSFGVTSIELTDFNNNFKFPSTPFDFVNFLSEYPEYNFKWIIIGEGPKFNGNEEECLRQIKERIYRKNHPEYFPEDVNKEDSSLNNEIQDYNLWDQIHFQNEQLKEKDAQIKQLLDILQKK